MRPDRPCSSRTAASSARPAGGDPSYPTTKRTNPAGGVAVVMVVEISPFMRDGPGPGRDPATLTLPDSGKDHDGARPWIRPYHSWLEARAGRPAAEAGS